MAARAQAASAVRMATGAITVLVLVLVLAGAVVGRASTVALVRPGVLQGADASTACHAPWISSVPGSSNAFARVDVEVPFEGEQRWASGARRPLLAVVGASFTAGVGAGSPFLGWPYLLGRLLGYRVMALGVPGAGYLRRGVDGGGPMRRELSELHLRQSMPRVVVVQAGHNDIGEAPMRLADAVRHDVMLVRSSDPGAAVVLLGVFPKGRPSAAARATSKVIAKAAHHADRSAVVVQPIVAHWHFPTIPGGLHPDPAGHRWIAHAMAAVLQRSGVVPTTTGGPNPGGSSAAMVQDRICPVSGISLSRSHHGARAPAARPAAVTAAAQ